MHTRYWYALLILAHMALCEYTRPKTWRDFPSTSYDNSGNEHVRVRMACYKLGAFAIVVSLAVALYKWRQHRVRQHNRLHGIQPDQAHPVRHVRL
jgi:hypothetical protein